MIVRLWDEKGGEGFVDSSYRLIYRSNDWLLRGRAMRKQQAFIGLLGVFIGFAWASILWWIVWQ